MTTIVLCVIKEYYKIEAEIFLQPRGVVGGICRMSFHWWGGGGGEHLHLASPACPPLSHVLIFLIRNRIVRKSRDILLHLLT